MLLNCVFVGLGGAAGSICRYLLGLLPLKPVSGFPAITLCINIAGAFALGLIGALAGKYAKLDRKSTRLNSSHIEESRMPSSA